MLTALCGYFVCSRVSVLEVSIPPSLFYYGRAKSLFLEFGVNWFHKGLGLYGDFNGDSRGVLRVERATDTFFFKCRKIIKWCCLCRVFLINFLQHSLELAGKQELWWGGREEIWEVD